MISVEQLALCAELYDRYNNALNPFLKMLEWLNGFLKSKWRTSTRPTRQM